ncbi:MULTISPECIES: hypothetical protein [Pseudomonas]|uniref:Lipoprotein n=1 Tax=Pseudomonas asplenii TaxID=53407 RepID=A0A0M9GK91_9PSED|nr:hypothetical protein [Pseudomonas fuscovaginae]KPA92980.1 hypothetical protein PF66_00723 [Pseudomonas fuscovaginae]KPA98743.1 hypothetical protein PF70_01135 [Pseudomonas fuscovaginae]
MPVLASAPSRLLTTTTLLLSALLAGCSVNGTYPDATEPDAAKLRFVANTSNATLDYFDAEHCDGQTTGILNNMLMGDTKRRAGMLSTPPKDARGYLEIKLKPGQETLLRVNTHEGYSVCGNGINFKPEANAEYELTFDSGKGQCRTRLQRVRIIDGKEQRTPVLHLGKGLPACAGRNPIFPKPPVALPDTPHRLELMNRIIDSSLIPSMLPSPEDASKTPLAMAKVDNLIAERKAKLGFTLPDDYWALYRQNLQAFDAESAQRKALTLQRYKDEYLSRLRPLKDAELEEWAKPEDKSAKPTNKAAFEQYKSMTLYYFEAGKQVTLEIIEHHLDRMAQMDQRYGVCERYSECWRSF